ncbi:MAG: FapA family protein, partial [Acidaminococcales bacterium]|nr:FapA family protein [Acidaminococcales bacterium]
TILHSKISAGKKVLVTGSKGLIAGGRITAGEEVDSKNIGTQMAPPTIVEVGINPALKEEYVKLKDNYRETLVKQESIKKSLLLIKPDDNAVVPESRQELYMKMTKANFSLLGNIKEIKERLVFIEEEFSKLSAGRIKCSGLIFPGVKLIINNTVYPVRDILQFSLFYLDGGEVKFAPYNQ